VGARIQGRLGNIALLALLAAMATACGRLSDDRAVALVRAYDAALIRGYREGDFQLVEPFVGPEELRKLTGLIGVKLDGGVTLDAELLGFEVLSVTRPGAEVVVETDERWYYRDRRIGTGEQVGQDSRDHYRGRYRLRAFDGNWRVAEFEFAAEPEVGRKAP
jgi:hypothetical protein